MKRGRSLNSIDRGRFVVLRHEGVPEPHFDLMFEPAEADGGLVTFRSPSWPIKGGTTVQRLDDHRRAYLDYEGPVSHDRGFVTRVQAGTYESQKVGEDVYRVAMSGQMFHLQQTDPSTWRMEPA